MESIIEFIYQASPSKFILYVFLFFAILTVAVLLWIAFSLLRGD